MGIEGRVVFEVFNLELPDVEALDRRPRHDGHTTKCDFMQLCDDAAGRLFDKWFDPIESAMRDPVRGWN